MSKGEGARREWRLYVQDMIDCCEKALSYTEGMDMEAFVADTLRYDATIRNIEVIGEAATNVPQRVRDATSEIPWNAIVGTRNRIVHAYMGIDDGIIWSIIQDAIPSMLPALHRLLETHPE